MSSDWYAYKTKRGDTLFFYNTKTGKHIWANDRSQLQFELLKNKDYHENCALSKEECKENPSHWRPYTLKSGDVLFYYNIITGEHKWDMNLDSSNSSSIPSEPVLLKYDIEGQSTSVDRNCNTITNYTGVKTEPDTEGDIQHDTTEADQSENFPENQFVSELNSIEKSSNFMALRSTVKKRNSLSYVNSKETSSQRRDIDFGEYFSDATSSSEDNCSNFSDELPEISSSDDESEDEQVQEERARRNKRRSSSKENSQATHTVTTDQEKIARERILNRSERCQEEEELQHTSVQVLLTQYEKEGRSFLFRSTDRERMPEIHGIHNIAKSSQGLEKENFEDYQEHTDSTNLRIYESESVSRYDTETSSVGGNTSPMHQNNRTLLDPIGQVKNIQTSCSFTQKGSISLPPAGIGKANKHHFMPTIKDVFSLPKNTTKLVVAKVNYEKGNQNIDNTDSSTSLPGSNLDHEAGQLTCRNSMHLQETLDKIRTMWHSNSEEEQGTTKLPCSETFSYFLPMARSGEECLESVSHISSPVMRNENNEGRQDRESEDMSARRNMDDDGAKSKITTWAKENTRREIQAQTDKDFEQEDNETSAAELSQSKETLEQQQDQGKKVMDNEQVSNTDHPDENSCTGSTVDLVEVSSDETSLHCSTVQKASTLYEKEQAHSENINFRYRYSIKCLLPMIGNMVNQTETSTSGCHSRKPAVVLSSQYLVVVPRTESSAPLTTVSEDKGDVNTGSTSGQQISTTNSRERNEVLTTFPAAMAIKQEQPETNRDVFDKQGELTSTETLTLPNTNSFPNDDALRSSPDRSFGNLNSNDHLSSSKCLGGARPLNGLASVTENVHSRYKCYYCAKNFCLQKELQRHLALRHLLFGGVFLCNSCDDAFLSHEELSKHLLLHDEVKPVKCRHCETEFVTVEELASHISSHVDEPKYPKYQKKRKALESVGTNESQYQDLGVGAEPPRRRCCTDCGKEFRHFFALRLHLRTHGKENSHSCLLCGKWYLDLKSLRKHAVIHLREKHLECDICHKTFRFHNDYLRHQVHHVPGQLFKCEKRGCREMFNLWHELRQHEIAVHEEKRFRCTNCGKSFSRQEKLIWHSRLHSGEKPLACDKCGRRFRTRAILKNHEKIHLESKTYKCGVCSKGFKQKCSMLRHVKTHRAFPKDYQCILCKKRFTQSCSLQRHQRIHSGEKFKCPKCPMKFLEAWRMRVHIKSKHSE